MSWRLVVSSITFLAIVVLILLGSSWGLDVTEETIASLRITDIFLDQSVSVAFGNENKRVVLQTVTISNDFFVPKVYELPIFLVCAYDGVSTWEARGTRYIGDIKPGVYNSDIFSEFILVGGHFRVESVDIGSFEDKKVMLSIDQIHFGSLKINEVAVQEIILYKFDSSESIRYPRCENAESKAISKVIIPVVR